MPNEAVAELVLKTLAGLFLSLLAGSLALGSVSQETEGDVKNTPVIFLFKRKLPFF